ncbi:MAG: hypothetical protein MRZ75_05270 [Roseburia sp.]|nr:hypothetical protein [Roseburia sp.]
MEKIKFCNSDIVYNCNLVYIKNDVYKIVLVTPLPSDDILLSGFMLLNEYNLDVMSDFSDYTTKYKSTNEINTIYLSTGEVFSESTQPGTTQDEGKEDEKELTEEEKLAKLEQVKKNKIDEMNKICEETINNGISIDGKQYSFTIQDQNNILNVMNVAKTTGLEVPYHANDESCALYTFEQVANIYMQEQIHLAMCQTYFNQLKLYIESILDVGKINDISSITWGTELTGRYLETYNMIIEQNNKVMQKLTTIESMAVSSEAEKEE